MEERLMGRLDDAIDRGDAALALAEQEVSYAG
jgi:hypothetical protein